MEFIEQYKAAIITFLITGIVVFTMFSVHITQHNSLISETIYELEPEFETPKEDLKTIEETQDFSSNKAFNEDQEYKALMKNFKSVSVNDFERTTKAMEKAKEQELQQELQDESDSEIITNNSAVNSNAYALKSEDTESYKKLQEELKKRLDNKKQADEHAKTKSSLTYSLKGRVLEYYNTPRYLCENGGKIVVSIRVNNAGKVTEASINGASNSNSPCLVNHAIEYAESVQFNASDINNQLGTITFVFKGK